MGGQGAGSGPMKAHGQALTFTTKPQPLLATCSKGAGQPHPGMDRLNVLVPAFTSVLPCAKDGILKSDQSCGSRDGKLEAHASKSVLMPTTNAVLRRSWPEPRTASGVGMAYPQRIEAE